MKQLLKLSVIAIVIVRLPFLCILQGHSVVGQTSGQMNFSHEEGRSNSQLQKRSFGDGCLEEIKFSWLRTAPFVYDIGDSRNGNKKSEEDTPIVKGIFVDVVKNAIAICWKKFCDGSAPQVRYLRRATTLKGLQLEFFRGSANIIIPVYSEEAKYGGAFPFVKILDSPGVVLIQRYSTVYRLKLVLKAVLGTWPVVVMALLMSFVAGLIIWLLDSSHNSEQFSRTFHQGVFQGFWWAFVTITTVGYGDKTPKSTVARSFAVVWMTVGVTICSVMTATLSSTLTSVKLERDDLTAGKRIGLLRDGVAFQDAISLAANITSFEDPGEMYDSLMNGRINGILMELLSGTEFIKARDMSKQLFVAKTTWRKRSFGVAYNDHFLNTNVSDCLSTVIKFSHNGALKVASTYTRSRDTEAASDGLVIKVFDFQSKTFLICVGVLSLLSLVCLISGKVVIFMTNHLHNEQKTDELSVGQNDSESKDAEKSSSVLLYGKQQTEV